MLFISADASGTRDAAIRATMWPMASDDSLTEGERFVLQLHPHWKTLLRPILILIVVVAAALTGLILLSSRGNMGIARLAIGVVAVVAIVIRSEEHTSELQS